MHDLSLIYTLTGALAVALLLGWITQRLGLSTLVGYLVAGIVVGPHTPGFVADAEVASRLAEIGVILLLFSVGMHFDLGDLWRVRRIAVPGAIAQSAVATVAGWAVARAFGWTDVAGIVFGMSLAVASTAVLTRLLVDTGRLATHGGHVAVGWLIVEDLFTVVALVVLPALAEQSSGANVLGAIATALAYAAGFTVIIWALGNRLVGALIERVALTRSEELFTLTVFVIALGIASLAAGLFHLSVALGAFFAGLAVGRSRLGPQGAAYMTPFRDVFSALFFVSVGMLFDPAYPLREPLQVLAAILIILVAKPLAAYVIVKALRDRSGTAETVAIALAQIGEFSFLLGAIGVTAGVLPQQALDTLVAAAIATIALNPVLFAGLARWERSRESIEQPAAASDAAGDERPHLAGHVIVVGEGALQRAFVKRLRERGREAVVIESDVARLEGWTREQTPAIFGDPARADVLRAAGADRAAALVVTSRPLAGKLAVFLATRQVNSALKVIATADDAAEAAWLAEFGADEVSETTRPAVDALQRALDTALSSR